MVFTLVEELEGSLVLGLDIVAGKQLFVLALAGGQHAEQSRRSKEKSGKFHFFKYFFI